MNREDVRMRTLAQASVNRRKARWRAGCYTALALASLAPATAHAQDAPAAPTPAPTPAPAETPGTNAPPADAPPAGIIYTPADFARFAPRSALDMVEQIPDFTLSESDGDRGLGEASQNVLLNGQRISGKSNDARSLLGSISASSVQRIEIVDGASLNIPGLTGRVANVIATAGAFRYQFQWNGQFRRNVPDQLTNGSISASGRIGASDITLSFNNDAFRRGGVGPELVTDATGTLLVRRDERAVFRGEYPRLVGTLRRQWSDGTILNLNLSGALYDFRGRVNGVSRTVATGALSDEQFINTEDEWNVEGGGDIEFGLGSGRLKLITVQRFEHSPLSSQFVRRPRAIGGIAVGSQFDRNIDEGESVLRGEYSWRGGGADWQLSVEGAYNFLDNASAFFQLQPDGSYLPITFDGANVFVDEWRAEALLTRGWSMGPGVTAQVTLGGEYSRIRTAGTNGLTREFWRPKGTLRLTWTPNSRWTVNAEFRRAVGQLSFYDFAARVDVQNNTSNGSNNDLVPDQSWRARVQVTHSLGSVGSITVGGYHEWITDIVDQIPLTATTEGIGNLPSARRWAVTFSGTLNLDGIGARGARISFSGEERRSRVRDPLTGQYRSIGQDLRRTFDINFRHDIPDTDLAWGASFNVERTAPFFRLDEITEQIFAPSFATVYWEHKDVFGLTARVSVRNLRDADDVVNREIYVNRRDGPIDVRERQRRRIFPILGITISGSF
jgi:outer membrane receptor for ferrienterochelin and colicins